MERIYSLHMLTIIFPLLKGYFVCSSQPYLLFYELFDHLKAGQIVDFGFELLTYDPSESSHYFVGTGTG